MAEFTLIIALVALVLSSIAYWRSGGRSDLQHLVNEMRQEIEGLRTKQRALTEEMIQQMRRGYEQSLQRLKHIQERLLELKEETIEGFQRSIDSALEELEGLKKRAEEGIASLKGGVIERAQQAEEKIARQVHRLEGRVQILAAKSAISRARRLVEKEEFDQAEELLRDAVNEIKEARENLADHDPSLDRVLTMLREAVQAVQSKAEDMKHKIDHVLEENEKLLSALEMTKSKENI